MPAESRAAIAGVTGTIGRDLPELLARRGMAATGISRRGKGDIPAVDRWQTPGTLDLAGHQAVVNLAGAPVDRRWTRRTRQRIRDSRVGFTAGIVDAIARLPEGERPAVLVNASAIGFYGDRGNEFLTESAAAGEDFLAEVCRDWESEALRAEALGVRVVRLRTGMVLGKDAPAFTKLRRVLGTGLGGKLGSGRQWVPWIHIDDLRAAIVHAVFSAKLEGPVNGTAPNPEKNAAFTRQFAAALRKPAFLPVPSFALRLALGGFAGALLSSQRAIPSALEADGFSFRHPSLASALADLTG